MGDEGKPEMPSDSAPNTVAIEQHDSWVRAIRREPLKAVAVAAGVGFVLALIVR